MMEPSIWQGVGLLLGTLTLYVVGEAFYNAFLHPLAKVPGPWYCRVSKLPWVRISPSGISLDFMKTFEHELK